MFLEFDSSAVKVSWPVYFVLYGVWTILINHIRCVVASRDIAAGELLLEDYPAVYGPKDQYLGRYHDISNYNTTIWYENQYFISYIYRIVSNPINLF